MLSNINISELKAKTIYHIYIMIQIKKATLLKNNKKTNNPRSSNKAILQSFKKKNSNYSPEENKLSAFVNAANFIYSEPHKLQVLLTAFGMMSKHAASIEVILNTEANKLTEELINEKFNDYINYCILIYLIKIEQ